MSSMEGSLLYLFVQILFWTLTLYYIYRWIGKQSKLPPGPVGLPFVGYLPFLGDKPYKELAKMKEKYGDIIGLKFGAYYTVVLNEYNIAKEVLSHPYAMDRSEIFKDLPAGFSCLSGKEWQEQRKFCIQAMRELGLGRGAWETLNKVCKNCMPVTARSEISEKLRDANSPKSKGVKFKAVVRNFPEVKSWESTRNFVEKLASFKNQPVDIEKVLKTVLSSNVIALILGRRLNPKTEAKELKCVEDFQDVLTYYGPSIGSFIPIFKKFCEHFGLFGYDKAKDITLDFNKLATTELEKHRRDSSYKGIHDFINLYDEKIKQANKLNVPHTFSDENLMGNMAALYLGGADTVTSTLTWLFRLTAKYPEIQRKVQEELDEVIGADGVVDYKSRHMIPYTVAFIQEAQRFSTIVPMSPARCAAYDFEVRDYIIPKGALICANTWAIHNDANVFPNPDKFQPERFLLSQLEGKDIPKTLVFSVGKRNCPGETVAWMVILPFFTSVMQKFTISPLPGNKVNLEIVTGLVDHLKPQALCFRERV